MQVEAEATSQQPQTDRAASTERAVIDSVSDGSDVAETGSVWWRGHFVKAGGAGSAYTSFSTAKVGEKYSRYLMFLQSWP